MNIGKSKRQHFLYLVPGFSNNVIFHLKSMSFQGVFSMGITLEKIEELNLVHCFRPLYVLPSYTNDDNDQYSISRVSGIKIYCISPHLSQLCEEYCSNIRDAFLPVLTGSGEPFVVNLISIRLSS